MGAGVKLLRRLADSKLVEVKKRSALTFAKPMENQTMTHQQKENNFTVFENHRKVAFNIASEASYIYILS